MATTGYTFSYYVSGHGFGHATRVNQIITELLRATSDSNETLTTPVTAAATAAATLSADESTEPTGLLASSPRKSRHTIYIVSDAPQFIFQDVIALGAIYRNAKVDAGVVQPLAYSVDRHKTIEGCKQFLSRRDEMIQHEVTWLAQVGVDCVLADAPFLPCAAASAYGIPAILITNFTFDEVYRFLQEGDDFDKDVVACADAALQDYKKASLLLRLPGSIDIPSFEDEIVTMELESTRSNSVVSPSSISAMDEAEVELYDVQQIQDRLISHKKGQDVDIPTVRVQHNQHSETLEIKMGDTTPSGILTPVSMITAASSPTMSISSRSSSQSNSGHGFDSHITSPLSSSKFGSLIRKAIDVPLVVRMAVNTREDVLRSLGVDEHTIATKKMVLVSFGGQRLKQGWGNPLPEGWIGVICGLPVEHELPEGFYRSPHGVYVPDLTEAADIVIGKLGYGTCSECIAHDKPLIYVSRPQFIEEQGLIKMMLDHGLPVEMTSEEFENGHWQRAIVEADRQVQEERQRCQMFSECIGNSSGNENEIKEDKGKLQSTDQEAKKNQGTSGAGPLEESCGAMSKGKRRSRRTASISSLSEENPRGHKVARLSPVESDEEESPLSPSEDSGSGLSLVLEDTAIESQIFRRNSRGWLKRQIPNNGGEVCAQHIEEFMAHLKVLRQGSL